MFGDVHGQEPTEPHDRSKQAKEDENAGGVVGEVLDFHRNQRSRGVADQNDQHVDNYDDHRGSFPSESQLFGCGLDVPLTTTWPKCRTLPSGFWLGRTRLSNWIFTSGSSAPMPD